MADTGPGYFRRLIGSVDHRAYAGGICTITADDTYELFNIMAAQCECRQAGHLAELRGAECIAFLSCMI